LTSEEAQLREKRIKKWQRKWKIQLIEKYNPEWRDISDDFPKKLTPIEKMDILFGKNDVAEISKKSQLDSRFRGNGGL